MPKTTRTGVHRPSSSRKRDVGYAVRSMQPLHVLIFLAPLIILYEIGTALYLTNPETGVTEAIKAYRLMANVFEVLGVGSVFLPGFLLVVVLIIWHVLARHSWRLHPDVLFGMLVEAAAWTLPLWVLAQLIEGLFNVHPGAVLAAAVSGGGGGGGGGVIASMSIGAQYTIAVGAGLYEEMLFRLVGIAAVHLVAADLLGVKDRTARIIAIVVTALAFSLYHQNYLASASGLALAGMVLYFFVLGLYLGAVYVWRGFGIVVAVHALFDIFVVTAAASH